jgi:long-subunit fatty acid transport protein
VRIAVALAIGGYAGAAHAGGFEAPGLGVEAMGRGAAFTAKSDDGTALEYNVAGFARQRGTRVLVEGKLVLNKYEFQRAGSYPTESAPMGGPMQPWSGMAYPGVSSNGISGAPTIAISSDFGYFDRWTFAIGLTAPSASDANRTFPTTVNGNWPAPQRYDLYHADILVVYPMLAAAVRVTKWLDIGLALQMVYGQFDLAAAAYADLGQISCPGVEYSSCDSLFGIKSKGFTATGVLGMMFHPLERLHIGINLRGPIYLGTSGTVNATAPPVFPVSLPPGDATLGFRLPWVVRLGLRYAFMDGWRERGDIEVDGTYEAWKEAEGNGDPLKVPMLGPFTVNAILFHHYKDTGSVRVGGAYNLWFKNDGVFTIRAGVFYDSSATDPAYTKLDFDTLDKIGGTLGLGYKFGGYRARGLGINLAYVYMGSPTRVVTDGKQQIINGTDGTTNSSTGMPNPAFNNGTFKATTQLIMLGLTFNIDSMRHKAPRNDPFGDPNHPGWNQPPAM